MFDRAESQFCPAILATPQTELDKLIDPMFSIADLLSSRKL